MSPARALTRLQLPRLRLDLQRENEIYRSLTFKADSFRNTHSTASSRHQKPTPPARSIAPREDLGFRRRDRDQWLKHIDGQRYERKRSKGENKIKRKRKPPAPELTRARQSQASGRRSRGDLSICFLRDGREERRGERDLNIILRFRVKKI